MPLSNSHDAASLSYFVIIGIVSSHFTFPRDRIGLGMMFLSPRMNSEACLLLICLVYCARVFAIPSFSASVIQTLKFNAACLPVIPTPIGASIFEVLLRKRIPSGDSCRDLFIIALVYRLKACICLAGVALVFEMCSGSLIGLSYPFVL